MTLHAFRRAAAAAIAIGGAALCFDSPHGQTTAPSNQPAARHARGVGRLLIRGAMVIPGTGTPAFGPVDLQLENGLIARMGNATAARWPPTDAIIDAAGKYVMPGMVDTHMHWHEERVAR